MNMILPQINTGPIYNPDSRDLWLGLVIKGNIFPINLETFFSKSVSPDDYLR